MNTRTARSQYMGGMIWGVSSALHEATEIDRKRARYVNDNLADYLVPVNADIEQLEVILVSEQDDKVNPAGGCTSLTPSPASRAAGEGAALSICSTIFPTSSSTMPGSAKCCAII